MSLPMKKKVSAYTDATPTLTDRVLGLKTTIVSNFTFQSIYDLFKSGFDNLYATQTYADNSAFNAANAALLSANNYSNEVAGIAQDNAITTANGYTDEQLAAKQNVFDYSGAGTGTNSVTINSVKGGVANFTNVIVKRTGQYLTINSDQIVAGSKILFTLIYDGTGYPFIVNSRISNGKVQILVGNGDIFANGGTDTNSTITIQYQIVG